jgi:hypothetical protein
MDFAGAKETRILDTDPAYFTWYELFTSDVAAAAAFYSDVVGWGTKDASPSGQRYVQFTAGEIPVAGLMELPEEALKQGARPRWMGYVSVRDVNAVADRVRRLGGTVYVPPTDTNIGRISVMADPHTAAFGVINRPQTAPQQRASDRQPGRVCWHELFAADLKKEAAFYCELLGWQRAETKNHFLDAYLAFSAGEHVIAGAFQKGPQEREPFWLFYFDVEDLDVAAERVRAAGGLISCNDEELPSGLWVAHCSDPQGAAFALQGKRKHATKIGWSTEWQGFSSRGKIVTPRPPSKN